MKMKFIFICKRLIFSEILNGSSLETVKVQKGDLIILSSDGLWDVIEADQLEQIIKRNANNVKVLDEIFFYYIIYFFLSIFKI